jgi:hypothetical protein
VVAKEKAMSSAETPIVGMISRIRENLAEALSIAKATETCARDDFPERALTISLDVEEVIHNSNHLLQAASAMNREKKQGVQAGIDED